MFLNDFNGKYSLTTLLICLLLGAGAYFIAHRLIFHPLANVPGPRLAALTYLYEFYYDGLKQGQYVFRIDELHREYGIQLILGRLVLLATTVH
jgi:hypothetical protein